MNVATQFHTHTFVCNSVCRLGLFVLSSGFFQDINHFCLIGSYGVFFSKIYLVIFHVSFPNDLLGLIENWLSFLTRVGPLSSTEARCCGWDFLGIM